MGGCQNGAVKSSWIGLQSTARNQMRPAQLTIYLIPMCEPTYDEEPQGKNAPLAPDKADDISCGR